VTAPRLPDDGKVRSDSHIPRPFPGRFDAVTGQAPGRIVTPLMRLRDPQYTKILLVTLAETTPVSEAARLQADLRRAKIEPFGWVINGSLATAGAKDPCLGQRVAGELEQIEAVRQQHAQRIAILLWMLEEPAVPLACSHWHAVG
jgi:arsenite/tail-anchored protein-transporting ATPase